MRTRLLAMAGLGLLLVACAEQPTLELVRVNHPAFQALGELAPSAWPTDTPTATPTPVRPTPTPPPPPPPSPSPSTYTPSRDGVTLANYRRLYVGMHYSDVVDLLGSRGREFAGAGEGKNRFAVWVWESSGFGVISLGFRDNRIVGMSHSLLE